jgi:protein-glutamine gamma-glutamyltransferase
VQARLAALGVDVGPQHAPRTRAARVRAALGARGEALAQSLEALDRWRYADADAKTGGALNLRRWWTQFRALAPADGG